LYERVQEWFFQFEVGAGVQWFRLGLFGLLVVAVVVIYTGARFFGLRDAEAMNLGQLGRNLWQRHSYVTQHIRPAALAHLAAVGRPPLRADGTQPELWTPPVYPAVLAGVFQLAQPDFAKSGRASNVDRILTGVAWVFFLVGLLLTYLLARALFDQRVAALSAFLYLLCDPLLDAALAGLPLHFLMVLFLAVVYGVYQAEQWQAAGKGGGWVTGALAVSAVTVAVGTLTRYAFAAVLVPLVGYVSAAFPKSRWRAGMCLAVFVLALAPWGARNWRVSRTFWGLATYDLYEETGLGTRREIRAGQLQRSYPPRAEDFWARRVVRKALLNLRTMYERAFKDVGANYLIAFFLAGLLHRFRREEISRLRWFVFWSMLAALVALSVETSTRWNFLNVFLPVVIIYAAAYFLVAFERLQLRTRLWRYGITGLFVGLNALPLALTLLPPIRTLPYPPYDSRILAEIQRMFRPDEMLASDIPWAVAWYADRSCLWVPNTREEFITINDNVRLVAGVYLTQETFLGLSGQQLAADALPFWAQLFRGMPADFPLPVVYEMAPQQAQILISNRRR